MADIMHYGETVKTQDLLVYIVQTTFPSYHDNELKPDKFGQYIISAYTPADDPGYRKPFYRDPRYAHLFINDRRAEYNTLRIHTFNDSIAFINARAAFDAAAALEAHAVLSSPYERNTDWAIKERGMPLKVRVVEHRLAMIDRVVTSMDHGL